MPPLLSNLLSDWSTLLWTALGCAMALYVWFQTNAAGEYIRLFNLYRILGLKNYEVLQDDIPELPLQEYLREQDNFLCRLLSCPICVACWLALATAIYCWSLCLWLPLTFLSLYFYHRLLKMTGNG
jgi:hypothetical protein